MSLRRDSRHSLVSSQPFQFSTMTATFGGSDIVRAFRAEIFSLNALCKRDWVKNFASHPQFFESLRESFLFVYLITPNTPFEEPRMGRETVWIVVPTLDERRNVAILLPHLLKVDPNWRIVTVDDDSIDGTTGLLRSISDREERVDTISGTGRGLGSALRAGISYAVREGASRIVTMDADVSHDPEAIPGLLAADADIVLGSRYMEGGRVVGWSRRRRAISFVANRFSRFSLGAAEKDVTTGFRAYSREMAEIILKESIANGYNFQVEAVHLAKRHRMSIAEVPITFRERLWGDSKLSGRREAAHLLFMLATRTPLRLFLLVALLGSLINELLLVGMVAVFNIHYLLAGIMAVEGGILTIFLLNEKWTFRTRDVKGWSLRLARYNLAVFGGLLLNLLVLFLLTEYANLLYLHSNIFGIGTALSWNYRLGGFLARRL